MTTGRRGNYDWLEVELPFEELLTRNFGIVEGKYLAITTANCCPTHGIWQEEGGILYTPPISSVSDLRGVWFSEGCSGLAHPYNEGYVFDEPVKVPAVSQGNVFELGIGSGRVFCFVNFLGFRLSDESMKDVTDLFWSQLEWIRPAAYVASGEGRSYLVSR